MIKPVNLHPSRKDVFQFGLIFFVLFCILAIFRVRAGDVKLTVLFLLAAILFLAVSKLWPPVMRPFYIVWMAVGFAIGSIVSRVFLALSYYMIFSPMALWFKLIGRDALALKKKEINTYWVDLPPVKGEEEFKRLF